VAAVLRRFLSYGGLERWIDPLAPAPVEQPPRALMDVYRYFLAPVKWLIVTTLLVSLAASVTELAMFAFLGSLVDRMSNSSPDRFVAENWWLLVFMSFVCWCSGRCSPSCRAAW
jgi:ATP-binding cassette subfamily B multidrug efflux pump